MSRAKDTLLDELHGTVGQALLDEIKAYRAGEKLDREGNPIPLPASLAAQAIKYLKDNGVDRAVKPGDPEDLLADELEDEFDGDNVFPINSRR